MREGDQLGDTGKPSGSRGVFRLWDKTGGKKICSTCEERSGTHKEGTPAIIPLKGSFPLLIFGKSCEFVLANGGGPFTMSTWRQHACPEAFSVEEYPYKRISQQGTDWSRSPPDFLSTPFPRGRRAKKGKIKFEPSLLDIAAGIKKTLVPTRVKKNNKKK